jgi:hypothetical protein
MKTDVRGNRHHGAGAPDAGKFARKVNSQPPGSLVEDPRTQTRKVSASKLAPGQLIVIGAGTSTTYDGGNKRILDTRMTAEVIDVEPFGRRTRIVFERQEGTRDTTYADPTDKFSVSATAFEQQEITEPASAAAAPTYEMEGSGVQPGDTVVLDLDNEGGPFTFTFGRDDTFRRAWEEAGRPKRVDVVAVGSVPDEPSDVALTLQFGNRTHELSVHREREVTLVDRDA